MERGFYNEDIEELLKEKADQYKMYPSDKVWKGIHRSLHSNRKWYWLSLVLFLSGVGYYTFMEFITPSTAGKPISGNNTASPASKQTENTESNNSTKAVIVPFGNPKQNNNTAPKQRTFVLNPDNNTETAEGVMVPAEQEQPTAPITVIAAVPDYNTLSFNDETPVYDLNKWQARKLWQPELAITEPAEADVSDEPAAQSFARVPAATTLSNPISINALKLEANTNNTEEDKKRAGWLAHNAVYELAVPRQRRLSWQLSFVPTMNYRTLRGSNHPSEIKSVPINPNPDADVDPLKLLNHKPALGFEVGSNILYAVNKTFTLKTGIQFNYIRYDIQAYSSNTAVPAIIALNTTYGGIVTGQLNSYTRYRNFNGDEPTNLTNQYFQLALPMGIEINLLGKKKLQVGIGGSLQPTYLLKKNPYLLTADFKYATEPALVRRWNVNTSAEAFISYKTGDLKWQVGPQLRYQLFSSFIKQYPIRENLFEYGIKIGVTKTIR